MLPYKKVIVTGGAGFVGSNLATFLKRDCSSLQVIALDNLYRRGSELAIGRLKKAGVDFIHGDIRCKEDLLALGKFDLMIECSAEPWVRAGYENDPTYLLQTNLMGTLHCVEAARKTKADLIFLSTSRVYSIEKLQTLPLKIDKTRFVLEESNKREGWSREGISVRFPTHGPRSLYGATKLASEAILEEYAHAFGLNIVINRCGVISGPWQLGKVDQGFVSLWISRHLFKGSLKYSGYGGQGRQVRDVLHVEDLYDLIVLELQNMNAHKGKIYNVGGGIQNAISLAELSEWCGSSLGPIAIASEPKTHPADIPYYVTDNRETLQSTGWAPKRSLAKTCEDIQHWLIANRSLVEPILQS